MTGVDTKFKISQPQKSYQLVQLYKEEDTLSYLWNTSPETLTGIVCPDFTSGLAQFCYSVAANKLDRDIPLLPEPAQLARSPVVVRWRNYVHGSEGSYCVKFPRYMVQSLKEASVLGYARMYSDSQSEDGLRALFSRWSPASKKTRQVSPNQCNVDVGMLSDFRLAKAWDDFAPATDFIFAEAKGKDGLWRCAYAPPDRESGTSSAQKRAHIKRAFKSWGYDKIASDVDDLWRSLRLTKCTVAWQTATSSNFVAAYVNEPQCSPSEPQQQKQQQSSDAGPSQEPLEVQASRVTSTAAIPR